MTDETGKGTIGRLPNRLRMRMTLPLSIFQFAVSGIGVSMIGWQPVHTPYSRWRLWRKIL